MAAADAREATERAAAGADTTDATPPEPPPNNANELHHGTTWKTTAGPGEPSRVSDDVASGEEDMTARAAALKGSGSPVMTPAIAAELKQRVRSGVPVGHWLERRQPGARVYGQQTAGQRAAQADDGGRRRLIA